MSTPPEYFERIAGSVNLPLLQSGLVVVVGIGTVGSRIALELARCGVGSFILIDGDIYEEANRARHVLSENYVGMNKAEGITFFLADEVPGVRPHAVPHNVDESMSDDELDSFLEGADLIVAATDDREAQRRIGRRALALSIPAIFPALYGDDGGEVIVQIDPRFPCFFCWDGFRTNAEQLRGVTALGVTTLPVIYTAIRLCLGILDPNSEHRRMMVSGPNEPPNQLFVQEGFAALRMATLIRRPNCPSCAVGPAQEQTTRPAPNPPQQTLPLRLSRRASGGFEFTDIGSVLLAIAGALIAWWCWCFATATIGWVVCKVAGLPDNTRTSGIVLIAIDVVPIPGLLIFWLSTMIRR